MLTYVPWWWGGQKQGCLGANAHKGLNIRTINAPVEMENGNLLPKKFHQKTYPEPRRSGRSCPYKVANNERKCKLYQTIRKEMT